MTGNVDNDQLAAEMRVDWTTDPITGRSNSSPAYLALVQEVQRLIVGSAHSLLTGDTEAAACTIVSNLAHTHGMAPTGVDVTEATEETPGNLSGVFIWNGRPFRFSAAAIGDVQNGPSAS